MSTSMLLRPPSLNLPPDAGIADAENTVWRDSRRFTLHVLRDFGLGKQSVETYINKELQDFMEVTQVGIHRRGGVLAV